MKKMYLYAVVAIVIMAVLLALLFLSPGSGKHSANLSQYIGLPVPQSVVAKLAVPNNFSNNIGIGGASASFINVNLSPLYVKGKPGIIYIGADYCPFCAVTRWGLITALLRFGTFSNLHYMTSSSTDVYPNTPTFTFHNSTYTSSYISFVSVETLTNKKAVLENPNQTETNLWSTYSPRQSIPFVDFGNKYIEVGALVPPSVLGNTDWNGTIANLTNGNSASTIAIVGSADVYTTVICKMTNFTPSSVCSQPYVQRIASSMR